MGHTDAEIEDIIRMPWYSIPDNDEPDTGNDRRGAMPLPVLARVRFGLADLL